jgi:hypothetical protein
MHHRIAAHRGPCRLDGCWTYFRTDKLGRSEVCGVAIVHARMRFGWMSGSTVVCVQDFRFAKV